MKLEAMWLNKFALLTLGFSNTSQIVKNANPTALRSKNVVTVFLLFQFVLRNFTKVVILDVLREVSFLFH